MKMRWIFGPQNQTDIIGSTTLVTILVQSHSVSRKRPFFDLILQVRLIVSRVDFIVFVLFLEMVGEGVLLYGS